MGLPFGTSMPIGGGETQHNKCDTSNTRRNTRSPYSPGVPSFLSTIRFVFFPKNDLFCDPGGTRLIGLANIPTNKRTPQSNPLNPATNQPSRPIKPPRSFLTPFTSKRKRRDMHNNHHKKMSPITTRRHPPPPSTFLDISSETLSLFFYVLLSNLF